MVVAAGAVEPLPWNIGVRPNSPPQMIERVVEEAALLEVGDQRRTPARSVSSRSTGPCTSRGRRDGPSRGDRAG